MTTKKKPKKKPKKSTEHRRYIVAMVIAVGNEVAAYESALLIEDGAADALQRSDFTADSAFVTEPLHWLHLARLVRDHAPEGFTVTIEEAQS